jgi:hypothetical protein
MAVTFGPRFLMLATEVSVIIAIIAGCNPGSGSPSTGRAASSASQPTPAPLLPADVRNAESGLGGLMGATTVTTGSAREDSTLRSSHDSELAAFAEPGLGAFTDSVDTEAVWFVWMRTFHHPVVVRVIRRDTSYALIGVELDGAGGYEMGKVLHRDSTRIDGATWRSLTAPLRNPGFWTQPPSDALGLDGATWTIAGSSGRRLYVTRVWGPEERGRHADVWAFGLAMLRAAKLARDPIY